MKVYVCTICGYRSTDLNRVLWHIEERHWREHSEILFLRGKWRKYRILREAGVLEVVKQ